MLTKPKSAVLPQLLPGHLVDVKRFDAPTIGTPTHAKVIEMTNNFNNLTKKVEKMAWNAGLLLAVKASKAYVRRLEKRAADLPFVEDEIGDALWATCCDARAFLNSACYQHKSLKIRPDARDQVWKRRYTFPAANPNDVRVGLHIAYLRLVHTFLPREISDDAA